MQSLWSATMRDGWPGTNENSQKPAVGSLPFRWRSEKLESIGRLVNEKEQPKEDADPGPAGSSSTPKKRKAPAPESSAGLVEETLAALEGFEIPATQESFED